MWTDELNLLDVGVCLVCGAVPSSTDTHGKARAEYFNDLGWHCWRSRVQPVRNHSREALLHVCPVCLAAPMLVAATIRERHGLAHMVDWLRSLGIGRSEGHSNHPVGASR
jgi:hypothetical protein